MSTTKLNKENHKENEESFLKRIIRRLDAKIVISILSLTAAIVMGFLASHSRTTIVDRIEKFNQTIIELDQFRTAVVLPDSLENNLEVRRIRRFQNRIYSNELAYISLAQKPNMSNEMMDYLGTDSIDGIEIINRDSSYHKMAEAFDYWIVRFKELLAENVDLRDDFVNNFRYIYIMSNMSLISSNIFTLQEINLKQKNFLNLISEVDNKHTEIINNDTYSVHEKDKRIIKMMKQDFFDNNIFDEYFITFHQLNMMYMKALNIYLLHKMDAELE